MQGMQRIKINRPRLAEMVYEQIVSGLLSGEIGPDQRLHQEKLAKVLSVSRTPVREALLRLEQEGLLAPCTNGGFEIRQVSPDEVRDNYQTRQAIEGFSAGLIAQNHTADTVADLRSIIEREECKTPKTNAEYYEANRTMHRAFVKATGNMFLLENFDGIWNRGISIQTFKTLDPPRLAKSLQGHMALCDAIDTGNFDVAQKTMHEHIAEGCELQLTAL